jgi:hypothetical protein
MARIPAREIETFLGGYLGGAALAANPDFAPFLARKMISCLYTHTPFGQMRDALEQDLLMAVYAFSQKTMNLRMDDGKWRHFVLADFRPLADSLMGIPFSHMDVCEDTYRELLSYASMYQSLSALKALYLRYGAYQKETERAIIVRLIVEQYAPADYENWLSPADCPKRGA